MTDIHASAGAYAVNALEAAELAEFEAHLPLCPACRYDLVELEEAAAELAVLALAAPPPTLRATVLTAIRSTPQVPAGNGAAKHPAPSGGLNGSRVIAPPRAGSSPGPRRALPEPAGPAAPAADRGDESVLRRQRRRSRFLTGLVAALLALALGLGGVVYTLAQQRQTSLAQLTLEQQLYAAPDVLTTTSVLAGGGQVTFIASRRLNRALFLGTGLPDPRPNRYQLWTATGPDPQNLTGVFRDVQVAGTESGIKVMFTGNVAQADFLAVNLEPAGSTPPAPTNPVLATAPTTI